MFSFQFALFSVKMYCHDLGYKPLLCQDQGKPVRLRLNNPRRLTVTTIFLFLATEQGVKGLKQRKGLLALQTLGKGGESSSRKDE